MAFAVSKQRCSAFLAVSAVAAGALIGSARASVIESSPSFPPDPLSFSSPTGAGCFPLAGACVTPGIFTLTEAVSTFSSLPAVQDVAASATYTGSLTTLTNIPLGSFTLSGPVDFEVLGRGSDTETGSWTTEITSLSLTGPLLQFGTLTATLDPDPHHPSKGNISIEPIGRGEFRITSFFDVFMDVTLSDRPNLLPTLTTTVGPILVVVGAPEPATWAMMLVGFIGLGFAGHRRARMARTTQNARSLQ
jgi:hypothetical protein